MYSFDFFDFTAICAARLVAGVSRHTRYRRREARRQRPNYDLIQDSRSRGRLLFGAAQLEHGRERGRIVGRRK